MHMKKTKEQKHENANSHQRQDYYLSPFFREEIEVIELKNTIKLLQKIRREKLAAIRRRKK